MIHSTAADKNPMDILALSLLHAGFTIRSNAAGTIENTNGLLRFFYPKGFDFRTISDEDLRRTVDLLNNRPRKCLGWKTPAQVFSEGVALD